MYPLCRKSWESVSNLTSLMGHCKLTIAEVPDVHYYQCDITDTPAVGATCDAIRQSHGHPTVLINNAGIANVKTILEVKFRSGVPSEW
jgi:NAD(P)-dependent dehydrogenase (short-subunit alcohol dehydrogenase family)